MALQMLTWDATSGRLRAEPKSFDALDLTATVPIPTGVKRKYTSYFMAARSPNEYSRRPFDQQQMTAQQ